MNAAKVDEWTMKRMGNELPAWTTKVANIPRVPQQEQTGRSWGHSGTLSCLGFCSLGRKGKPALRLGMSACLFLPLGPDQARRETVSTTGSDVEQLCTGDKKNAELNRL